MSSIEKATYQNFVNLEEVLISILSDSIAKQNLHIDVSDLIFRCCKGKFFSPFLTDLESHINKIHTNWSPYICERCDIRKVDKCELRQHAVAVHGRETTQLFSFTPHKTKLRLFRRQAEKIIKFAINTKRASLITKIRNHARAQEVFSAELFQLQSHKLSKGQLIINDPHFQMLSELGNNMSNDPMVGSLSHTMTVNTRY